MVTFEDDRTLQTFLHQNIFKMSSQCDSQSISILFGFHMIVTENVEIDVELVFRSVEMSSALGCNVTLLAVAAFSLFSCLHPFQALASLAFCPECKSLKITAPPFYSANPPPLNTWQSILTQFSMLIN